MSWLGRLQSGNNCFQLVNLALQVGNRGRLIRRGRLGERGRARTGHQGRDNQYGRTSALGGRHAEAPLQFWRATPPVVAPPMALSCHLNDNCDHKSRSRQARQ
ncbi:MAG: hypothetical protein ACK4Z4_11695 [Ferrovibrio sp.]